MIIPAQSGCAFHLAKGATLVVVDLQGAQVCDLFCFRAEDPTDGLSSGRSIDYNETTAFTTGHTLYSNAGRILLRILSDTCGRHDFLVTPCNLQMFRMIARDETIEHPSCQQNLAEAFAPYGIISSLITTTFNIFMNVPIATDGSIKVLTPLSKAGDSVSMRAETDLIVGLTACSDEGSNGGSCKQIEYHIR